MTSKYIEIHRDPQGPGDKRPTAAQIIDDQEIRNKWSDKTILITGCSSGLGTEIAQALATTGAALYLTVRDLDSGKAALAGLTSAYPGRIHLLQLDLSSLESVRACANSFLAQGVLLHVLICNAGVLNTPEGKTVDGFETQLGVNHLAHFLLFNLLAPKLLESAKSQPTFDSRVIFVSSMAHRFGSVNFDNINLTGEYDPGKAYFQSKTANIWTANEIERRFGAKGLHAWSVHPGGSNTGLHRHMSKERQEQLNKDPNLFKTFKSPDQAAATTVWAACASALEGQGGKYLEDCQIIGKWNTAEGLWAQGHGPHAYDEASEARLWVLSEQMVGLDHSG
ncbi:hypothetical protein NM208_g2549 [Fusarium decemcellulare]|uniref:Uncharacterized protein n=2 Tax=Fusarium decemcellulare TaxID=57161 RepID=A0ACC1SG56_9HYPO|nr:hypothetical protein NM208_g5706 [Fusarium decemcellulare]KAJ3545339.1 hypothetical protein NM208_g2549 [Fusarium decemcellulare]